jgi:SOS-response transcriptional repressor LexA
MTENRSFKVFLLYSRDDKTKVRKLYRRLISDKFDVWLDEERLIPGQDWQAQIRKSINDSNIVIACISTGSLAKEGYVQKELHYVLDKAEEKPDGMIYLIPARLDDCLVPDKLSRYHWVNLFERSSYNKLKESLIRSKEDQKQRYTTEDVETRGMHEEKISIPILGPIAAGLPIPVPDAGAIYIADEINGVDVARSLLPGREKGAQLFALKVQGESMIDAMINDGDIVILKSTAKARNGDMVAVWLPALDETTLKYFYDEKKRYRLQSANPSMQPIYVSKKEPLEIKGKVVMVIRKVAVTSA